MAARFRFRISNTGWHPLEGYAKAATVTISTEGTVTVEEQFWDDDFPPDATNGFGAPLYDYQIGQALKRAVKLVSEGGTQLPPGNLTVVWKNAQPYHLTIEVREWEAEEEKDDNLPIYKKFFLVDRQGLLAEAQSQICALKRSNGEKWFTPTRADQIIAAAGPKYAVMAAQLAADWGQLLERVRTGSDGNVRGRRHSNAIFGMLIEACLGGRYSRSMLRSEGFNIPSFRTKKESVKFIRGLKVSFGYQANGWWT